MTPKIYTKQGDTGLTDLNSKTRLAKDELPIEVLGNLDELNSAIGIVTSYQIPQQCCKILMEIQKKLFELGSEICTSKNNTTASDVTQLEDKIDKFEKTLPTLKDFIIPGGSSAAAHCHFARAVCRRVERSLVALNSQHAIHPETLKYMNRLSDLLFVMAKIL